MQCSSPDCPAAPVYSFLWPWGEAGACCAAHQVHMRQKADQLERGSLHFTLLDPQKPVALARDERTQLIAARMSAEEEMRIVQARAAELHKENSDLAAECRRLRARDVETKAQLKDREADVARALKERDEALANVGEAQAEVRRLTPLTFRREPETSRFTPPNR